MARVSHERVGNEFTSWLRNEIRLSGKSFDQISAETGLDKRSVYRHYEGTGRPYFITIEAYWRWSGMKISLDELMKKVNLEWRETSGFENNDPRECPFGNWLKDRMIEGGYDSASLSIATGISKSAVWNHVNGFRNPKFSAVRKYCEVFCEEDPFKIYQMVLLNEK